MPGAPKQLFREIGGILVDIGGQLKRNLRFETGTGPSTQSDRLALAVLRGTNEAISAVLNRQKQAVDPARAQFKEQQKANDLLRRLDRNQQKGNRLLQDNLPAGVAQV